MMVFGKDFVFHWKFSDFYYIAQGVGFKIYINFNMHIYINLN